MPSTSFSSTAIWNLVTPTGARRLALWWVFPQRHHGSSFSMACTRWSFYLSGKSTLDFKRGLLTTCWGFGSATPVQFEIVTSGMSSVMTWTNGMVWSGNMKPLPLMSILWTWPFPSLVTVLKQLCMKNRRISTCIYLPTPHTLRVKELV
jgi:hypothetical protein